MDRIKSKLPSPGNGGANITDELKVIGRKLKTIMESLTDTVTGGSREQSYGWVSQYFGNKVKQRVDSSIKRRRTNRENRQQAYDEFDGNRSKGYRTYKKQTAAPLGRKFFPTENIPAPTGVSEGEILDLMKRNYDQEKIQRQVQKSFLEEKFGEDQERHEELVKGLKTLTNVVVQGRTATAAKSEEKGLFDVLTGILSSIAGAIKGLIDSGLIGAGAAAAAGAAKTVGKAIAATGKAAGTAVKKGAELAGRAVVVASRAVVTGAEAAMGALASVPGGAALLFLSPWVASAAERRKIEENPNAPEYKFNPYAMKIRGEVKTENEGAEKNRRMGLKQYRRAEIESFVDSKIDDRVLREELGATREELKKWLQEHTDNRHMYQAPVKTTPTNTLMKLGIEESTAGAGRGEAQLYDYQRQQLEEQGSKAAFGVRSGLLKDAKPKTTPVPAASPVSDLTNINRQLEDNYTMPVGGGGSTVVQQNGSSSVKNEAPIPSTAEQRNDEPMTAFVFRNQRRKARAY